MNTYTLTRTQKCVVVAPTAQMAARFAAGSAWLDCDDMKVAMVRDPSGVDITPLPFGDIEPDLVDDWDPYATHAAIEAGRLAHEDPQAATWVGDAA